MGRPRKYPFHELAPGETVIVPWPDGRRPEPTTLGAHRYELTLEQQRYRKLTSAVYEYGRYIGARYSVRARADGVHITRRPEPVNGGQ